MRKSKEKVWEDCNQMELDKKICNIYLLSQEVEEIINNLGDELFENQIKENLESSKKRHHKYTFHFRITFGEARYILEYFRNCKLDTTLGSAIQKIFRYLQVEVNKIEKKTGVFNDGKN